MASRKPKDEPVVRYYLDRDGHRHEITEPPVEARTEQETTPAE